MLNLLSGSPGYVLFEDGHVSQCELLPADAGISMLAGTTRLADGSEISSVLTVDASSGEIHSNHWSIDGDWYDSTELDARKALGRDREEVFPYDWSLSVRLIRDVHHG